jgi:hypothetical protein
LGPSSKERNGEQKQNFMSMFGVRICKEKKKKRKKERKDIDSNGLAQGNFFFVKGDFFLGVSR